MPIQPIESRRLYRQIADQIEVLIRSGEFAPGKRLPAERELARILGVSRPSLREAVICLEIAGLVEVKIGSGIFVCSSDKQGKKIPVNDELGPFELLRARSVIEGEIAALAAKSATKNDIKGIEQALTQMIEDSKGDLALESRQEADRLFHMRIAEATRNSAFVFVVRNLWDHGRGTMWKKMEKHFRTEKLKAQTIADHRLILSALKEKDSEGARQAMQHHLQRVAAEFTQRLEAD